MGIKVGYFYVGGKTNQKKRAYGKIGESNQKYLSTRVGQIRHKEGNFVVFKYLKIFNSSKAITRAIEGHVRFMLERAGYHNIQNDHFEWNTSVETKMTEYNEFTEMAILYAKQYCELIGVQYEECVGDLNARRTCRHKK